MSFFTLFMMFFKIGLFGFGGGVAILPLIFQSVQDFGLMTAQEFSNLVALSQVTPGPIAINAATYVGFSAAGVWGSAVATFAVCLPSMILILLTMRFMNRFQESRVMGGILAGIRPATIGLIAAAVIFVAETSLISGNLFSKAFYENFTSHIDLAACGIFGATLVLAGALKVNPIVITIIMAAAGVFLCG